MRRICSIRPENNSCVTLELAPSGVRVNSVHPGAIDTPMLGPNGELDSAKAAQEYDIILGRVGQPVEVAQASLFLSSNEAYYITGAELAVDGGWSTPSRLTTSGQIDSCRGYA